jgi:hypothetical protein
MDSDEILELRMFDFKSLYIGTRTSKSYFIIYILYFQNIIMAKELDVCYAIDV